MQPSLLDDMAIQGAKGTFSADMEEIKARKFFCHHEEFYSAAPFSNTEFREKYLQLLVKQI